MKNFIPLLLLILLTSCAKETLIAPKTSSQSITTTTAVSYTDNSISVVDFKARQDSGTINVSFTTLYEKNIVKLEILKGLTPNHLCSIYKQAVSTNSDLATKYSTSDQNNDGVNCIYYMVKYTLANGDWGYTPVFRLDI